MPLSEHYLKQKIMNKLNIPHVDMFTGCVKLINLKASKLFQSDTLKPRNKFCVKKIWKENRF